MVKQEAKRLRSGKGPPRYPDDIKKSAIEMFMRSRADFNTRAECARHVADLLGIGAQETVLSWVKQAEVDSGVKEGLSTDEREEIKRLRREVAELRRANGILKAASAFFAAERGHGHKPNCEVHRHVPYTQRERWPSLARRATLQSFSRRVWRANI